MAGFVLPALASSALGTATPVASPGSRGCVCPRRLGRNRGLGNHFLKSRTCRQYGLALSSLDSGTSHASRHCRSWHCCKLPTAILVVGATRSACLHSGTDNSATEASLNKMFTTSWPLQLFVQLTAFWACAQRTAAANTRSGGRSNDWADDLSRGRLACTVRQRHSAVSDRCALAPRAASSSA